jgi:hypothetical protein
VEQSFTRSRYVAAAGAGLPPGEAAAPSDKDVMGPLEGAGSVEYTPPGRSPAQYG